MQHFRRHVLMHVVGLAESSNCSNSHILFQCLTRYMPMSRDLSSGKERLIKNWIECGMPREQTSESDGHCTAFSLENGVNDVRRLLEKAVLLELTTIPVYMTAWLSLKTEYGRNKQIANILKSIYIEEMLHMALAANVLNSIGGSVNLTDERKLPTYPTVLSAGYQILPSVEVSLEPFSIGLTDDVLSAIERPSDFDTKNLIKHLAMAWEQSYADRPTPRTVGRNMKNLLNELLLDENRPNRDNLKFRTKEVPQKSNTWRQLRTNAESILKSTSKKAAMSVGGLYSVIALQLVSLESCAKLLSASPSAGGDENTCGTGTIFNTERGYQLNMSHWYQKSNDAILEILTDTNENLWNRAGKQDNTRPPIFEVTDLQSALEAIVEIVYQGEGGSECSPFVPQTDIYASLRGRDKGSELSHYYRLQEIVHGNTLLKMHPSSSCGRNCITNSTAMNCFGLEQHCYCYTGEAIPFYADGVWQILRNPKRGDYVKESKAQLLNEQFNLLYTRLLFCLEEAFNGQPSMMKQCMPGMYDMVITGKRLVQTPAFKGENTFNGMHAAPTWEFVREKWYSAGLPIRSW